MSYSTFYGMEIARSGLYTAQSQLNITGHNISNVDTVGYTRQRLSTAAKVVAESYTQIALSHLSSTGQGSEALGVDQVRDLFLDATYRDESSETAYWDATENQFYMVEQIFDSVLEDNDSSASIYNTLSNFATALSNVTKEVSSKDIRQTLVESGLALTESFNYVYGKLAEQHSNINVNISTTVDQINDIASEIANLNYQIFGYELTGAQANDLRDQRNTLMDDLSKLTGYDYYENQKGHMVISMGGIDLVNGYDVHKLAVYEGAENQLDILNNEILVGKQYQVVWTDYLGKPSVALQDRFTLDGGKLQAFFDIRDGLTEETGGIPYVVSMLNDLARQIASDVNEVSRQGWTLPYTEADAINAGGDIVHHSMVDDGTGKMVARVDLGEYVMETKITKQTAADGSEYYPSVQGVDIFEAGSLPDYSQVTAKNFSLSSAVIATPYAIPCSSEKVLSPHEDYTDENQLMGNNLKVSEMLGLFNKTNELGLPDNFSSRLTTVVTSVATTQAHNKNMNDAQQTRLAAIEEQRQSNSGVSLDDEMTDMVRFQHAYNASARILTAVDEQLDTLINKMGMVGR